jgi:hypothetical protein
MANKDDIKNQQDLNKAKAETNRLSAEENKFLELGRKIAAETTEQTRNLGQELRDMLGLSRQRNDYDKALLGLSRDITTQAQKNAVELGRNKEISKEILKNEKILESARREQLINAKGLNAVQIQAADKIAKAQLKRQEIISEIDDLYDKLATADEEAAKKLKEDIAKREDQLASVESSLDTHLKLADADTQRLSLATQLVQQAQKNVDITTKEGEIQKDINEKMGITGDLVKSAGGLMSKLGFDSTSVSDGLSKAEKAMEEFADEAARSGKEVSKMEVAMKGLGPLIGTLAKGLTDPAVVLGKIVSSFFELNKAGTKFQQQTGMNADALAGANSELATSVDFLQTAGELSTQIGTNAVVALGPDLVAAAAGLKNELGLSAENAGMLAVNAKLAGMSMEGLESQVQAATDEFNNTTDSAVSSTQVIRDMGKASKAVQAQFSQYPGGLAKAAAAARKIGMELKDMEGIMDGLLNFEDSIAAEMEAELLTGKELNLNKARELALSNDIEGVANELFKNAQDVTEFGKMNRIQQEAYAKSLGMSRDQLAEMAIQKGILNGMSDEEKAKIRGVTLEESKRMDIQENLQKSLDKLSQAIAPMLEILVPIAEVLGTIIRMIATPIGYLMKWADALKGIGGTFGEILSIVTKLAVGGGILLIAKSLKDAFNPSVAGGFFENLKKNFGGIGKMAGGLKDKLLGKGKDKAADVASKAKDKLTEKAADQTGDLADKTKDAKGDGPGGFLKGLGDGLASIGKQFGDVVKGALALGIAGLALGGSFALALKMVQDVDPVTMLAFAGSIGIFGASLALVGKLGNDAIKGAIAMGIAGVALIPAAYAFSLMAGVDPMSVVALSGSLIALGIAAALMGNLGGQIIMGALALGILALALIPAAYAFSLLGSVDPMAVIAMTGSLIALGAAAAIMGMTGPMVLAGAAAIGVLALAMIPAAYAFSLLGSVDPMAITAMVASLVVLGGAAALIGMTGPMVLAGAAAIGILAMAMIPAAFAFSLLQGVDTASIMAFSIALPLLALATAGLGFVAPFIMAGAAALTVLGLALIPAATAFGIMAGADIQGVVDKLSMLAEMGPGLMMAGVGLIAAAGGLAVFAAALAGGSLVSGLTSLFTGGGIMEDLQNLAAMAGPLQSVAGSLTAIAAALGGIGAALATMDTEKLDEMQGLIMTTAFAAPAIAAAGAIGDMISGIAGGGEESGKSESNEKLIAKIDELIVAVKQGKNINMDGRKVGGTLAVAATNT